MNEAKELTEISLQEKEVPLDVCIENLTTREGRQDIDLVQDEVENQLHKVIPNLYLFITAATTTTTTTF